MGVHDTGDDKVTVVYSAGISLLLIDALLQKGLVTGSQEADLLGGAVLREPHQTTTTGSVEEESRQGLDLAPGSGLEHVWRERTQ